MSNISLKLLNYETTKIYNTDITAKLIYSKSSINMKFDTQYGS